MGTKVEADSLDQKGDVYVLTGSAEVERDGAVIKADRIVYNEATGDAQAEGSVFYEDPDVKIWAERADVNLHTDTGTLYDARMFFKRDEFHIYSPEVRKTGEDRYFLTEAMATTCDPPHPAWCVTGDDVDVYVGERLIVRHATLRVKDVPVLYYPYIWAPIVSDRRTGFLAPQMGYRNSLGGIYKQQFFWVLAENRDLTVGVDVYTEKGLGQSLEYRYVERPGLRGEFSIYHARDGEADRDYYELTGWHRQSEWFLDVNLLNYKEFYRRYETFLADTSPRFLESQTEASAEFGTSRLYVASRYLQDLMEGSDDDTVPQKLPEAGYFLSPRELGPVLLSGKASATNVERDEGADGQRYEAGLTAYHSAGRGLTLSQVASAQEVYYDLDHVEPGGDGGGFADTVYSYSAALKFLLRRDYGGTRHELEPSLSYSYLTRDGREPPLFDSVEDMEEGSVASVSVVNRLKDAKGEFLKLKLSQGYDFDEEEDPLTPLSLELSLFRPLAVSSTVSYSFDESRIESITSKVRFRLAGVSFAVSQTYSDASDVNTFKLTASRTVASGLTVKAGASYDDTEEKKFEELSLEAVYERKCWGVAMSVVDTPEDFALFLTVKLQGLGSYRSEVYAVQQEGAE